jgi:hypothetical protein
VQPGAERDVEHREGEPVSRPTWVSLRWNSPWIGTASTFITMRSMNPTVPDRGQQDQRQHGESRRIDAAMRVSSPLPGGASMAGASGVG